MKKIHIKGSIIPNDYKWIYDWLEWDATSPRDVYQKLEQANGEPVEVIINSGGGYVDAGSEIYTALKDYAGDVIVKVVSLAASMASVIAMAGKRVLIAPTAQIMIHNVSGGARGDHHALRHGADVLENYNKSIANAYILKTGMSQEELLELMNKETYLNAQQALEKGFADEIMFDDGQLRLTASIGQSQLLPPEIIDRLKNEFAKHNLEPSNKGAKPIPFIQQPEPTNKNQKEVNEMDLEKLKNEHPDLYNQAFQAGAEQERNRIKALDELIMPGNEAIINKAKYETHATAEQTAMEILKAQNQTRKEMGEKLFEDAKNSGIDKLDSATGELKTSDEIANDLGSQIANIINQNRGGKK